MITVIRIPKEKQYHRGCISCMKAPDEIKISVHTGKQTSSTSYSLCENCAKDLGYLISQTVSQ